MTTTPSSAIATGSESCAVGSPWVSNPLFSFCVVLFADFDVSTRSNNKQTLPPKRGLVTILVVKSVVKSVTEFVSFVAGNGNGEEENGTSLTTPPLQVATTPMPDPNRVGPTRLLH
ncbi:hypothetical protein D0Y65_029954 [Glycine soja]|uniref:Uncharacterized protein n=1 Tax=Glycine soja TaxID=3848 RepID=A0A445I335_GLYSO|nr:hypothetical protein D0Y65_029954 [Glycine soja]